METLRSIVERVEFKESFRGYDRDQVDAFLERLARGNWVEVPAALPGDPDQRWHDAVQGATLPEPLPPAAPVEPLTPVESEDHTEAWRILAMAQKTADLAVAEASGLAFKTRTDAEADAAKLREQATAEANELMASAQAQAQAHLEDTQATARREAADARGQLRLEVEQLAAERDQLRADLEALSTHVAGQRQQVAATAESLRAIATDPDHFRVDPAPAP